jgi:hypothetical protein
MLAFPLQKHWFALVLASALSFSHFPLYAARMDAPTASGLTAHIVLSMCSSDRVPDTLVVMRSALFAHEQLATRRSKKQSLWQLSP